jgi:hypothetical protein
MPQANATATKLADKARLLKDKHLVIEYKPVASPAFIADFYKTFKSNSSARTSQVNEYYIHVMPDFRYIFMMILFHAANNSKSFTDLGSSKVSAATYAAYCLTIVYAFFLIHEVDINPEQNKHSSEFADYERLNRFYNLLTSLPVPKFLETILERFRPATTARRQNIYFLPSFKGFTHHSHFGRIFPTHILYEIHDIIANCNQRTPPEEIRADFNRTTVLEVNSFTAGNNVRYEYLVCNFFASLYSTGATGRTNEYLGSKLNQAMQTLFNPIKMRNYQATERLATIGFQHPKFDSHNYNPYIMAMNCTNENLDELQIVLRNVASAITQLKDTDKALHQLFDTPLGPSILDHAYSNFTLPTWDHNPKADKNDYPDSDYKTGTAYRKFATRSNSDQSSAIYYKTPLSAGQWTSSHIRLGTITGRFTGIPPVTADPAATAAVNALGVNIRFTPVQVTATDVLLSVINSGPNLPPTEFAIQVPEVVNYNIGDIDPSNIANFEISSFNEEQDVSPDVDVLHFIEADTESSDKVTLCGMIIESIELSMTGTPYPNPRSNIEDENAQYLSSAISYQHVKLGSSFSSNQATSSNFVDAPKYTASTQPAVSMLRDHTRVFDASYLEMTLNRATHVRNPGLTKLVEQAIPALIQTFIGRHVQPRSNRRAPRNDEPVDTPDHSIMLWSPYTITNTHFNEDWDDDTYEDAIKNIFYLSNVWTIYGLDATFTRVHHPSSAMPVA